MGSIAGTITSDDGSTIQEATLYVVSGPSHTDLAAMTDELGNFRLSGLDAGMYVIEVNAEGYMPLSGRIPVRSGRVTRANATLRSEEVLEIEAGQPSPRRDIVREKPNSGDLERSVRRRSRGSNDAVGSGG